MLKTYQYRIYPTEIQKEHIKSSCDNLRFVWNYFLTQNKIEYQATKKFMWYNEMSGVLTQLKKDLTWLNSTPAAPYQQTLKFLNTALKQIQSKNFPKYKSKKRRNIGIKIPNQANVVRIEGKYIRLSKFGLVKIKYQRPVSGRIISATITQNTIGQYYVSLLWEEPDVTPLPLTDIDMGIDLGIKAFAVDSDGQSYQAPIDEYNELEKKIKRLQQIESKKKKGSNNRKKIRLKINRLWNRIKNMRSDFLHKTSGAIAKQNSFVGVEDLAIKELLQKNKAHMNHAINQQSWSEFVRQLTYKLEWAGGQLVKIGQFVPSTQVCSCCGRRPEKNIGLNIRTYKCSFCGSVLDRDLNAARNIKQYAILKELGTELAQYKNPKGWSENVVFGLLAWEVES